MNDAPQYFTYDAERSVMVPRRPKLADKTYVDGELYRLGVIEERSENSHRAYFAELHSAWLNLPERESERFPTSEHLRKYALIKTGFYDADAFPCASKAEALRLAAFIRPHDEFALVVVKDATVTRYTAKSQSYKAMGRDEFQKSKTAVLDYVSSLIGTTREQLRENA